MDPVPDPEFMPSLQSTPARHPASAIHPFGQIFPLDSRLQDEQDACERCTIGHTRPSRS